MEFTIGKAFLSEYDFFKHNIPEGEYVAGEYIPSPEVYTRDIEGVGNCSLSYVRKGTQSSDSVSSEMPLDEGNYNIYLYVTEGKCYHSGLFHLGSFSISLLTSDEWSRLNALHTELVEQGFIIAAVTHGGDVVGQRVDPHVGHVVGIKVHGNAPLEGGAGYAQVVETGL